MKEIPQKIKYRKMETMKIKRYEFEIMQREQAKPVEYIISRI